MNEITKWPVVILTNYRTGSSVLGHMLGQRYGVPYFEEPAQHGGEVDYFIEFVEGYTSDKYVVKFMIDQIQDCHIYQQLLDSECFKIRLMRDDELNQCVSYYIAMNRQVWDQKVEVIENPYEVEVDVRAMTWAATAIHQNNLDLIDSLIKFDLDYKYEELDLSANGIHYKTTPPTNLEAVRTEMNKILEVKNFGHYNSGWKTFKHQGHVAAREENIRTGYAFDWYYLTEPNPDKDRLTTFSIKETRHDSVDFWPLWNLPPIKRIWANNNPRMEIAAGDEDYALERNDETNPFIYSIIPYPRARTTKMTDGSLTRITEYHCIDKKFLIDMFIDRNHQNDYWEQYLYDKKNNISFETTLTTYEAKKPRLFCGRATGDNFSFSLYLKFINSLNNASFLYVWSTYLEPDKIFFPDNEHNSITEGQIRLQMFNHMREDLVVIGIKDHMTCKHFDPWTEVKPSTAQYLDDMFTFYGEKKFIMFTSMEKLDSYITNKNVYIVPWGGDITNHRVEYQDVGPVLDKNLDSEYTYLSLNRGGRSHRAAAVQLLHGMDIQKHGLISCMFSMPLPETYDFQYDTKQKKIKELIDKGLGVFDKSLLAIQDSVDIYKKEHNDNPSNFKEKLVDYYRNSFVEIVSETSFTEKAFLITEKTLNSIYGCSFPIFISSAGTVELLRNMGMDMFDDIIDHSYDLIENPVDRLYQAIRSNLSLLTNNKKTKRLWSKNKDRFKNNVTWAQTTMYDYYTNRAQTIFDLVVRQIGGSNDKL